MIPQKLWGGIRHIVAHIAGAACSIILSRPVEGGLLLVNIFLFRSALRAFHRARFAATVRIIKDLRSDDVRYLLDQLPPWISDPQWERCAHLQSLLGLLWPAINTTVCAIIKRELEERVQESSDFGHIAFSRISFGKQVPVVAGIKAVPLQGEDLLAMVVDIDIRWAGEPDVVLALTKLGGATLGLSNVQLAGIVRLVFSPITEDPPFLRHMTVSLLNTPYVDFSVRALGGPDLMSLPAISSWLKTVVANLCDRVIVWPKEVHVPIAPRHRKMEEEAVAEGIVSPIGILVVRVGSAEIQPRRSTFLGRLKIPSPRLALIMPHPGSDGVAQVGLTAAREKTLNPSWSQQFTFVVTRPDQHLRLLLSHKRMDLLATDMPLGAAEIVMEDVLMMGQQQDHHSNSSGGSGYDTTRGGMMMMGSRVDINNNTKNTTTSSPFKHHHRQQQSQYNNATTTATTMRRAPSPDPYHHHHHHPGSIDSHHDVFVTPRPSTRPSPIITNYTRRESTVDEADYESASSTPRQHSVAWASPSTSLRTVDLEMEANDDGVGVSVRSRQQTMTWASASSSIVHIGSVPSVGSHSHSYSYNTTTTTNNGIRNNTNNSSSNHYQGSNNNHHHHHHQGLGTVLDGDAEYDASDHHWMPLNHQHITSTDNNNNDNNNNNNNSNNINIDTYNTTNTTTTNNTNSTAQQSTEGWLSSNGVWIQIPSTGAMTMAGMVSTAVEPRPPPAPTPFAGAEEQRGWLSSLQSFVLGSSQYGDLDSDDDDALDEAMGATVGRVQLTLEWIPVTAAKPVSPRTMRERRRHERRQQHKGRRRSNDGDGGDKVDVGVSTNDGNDNNSGGGVIQQQVRSSSFDIDTTSGNTTTTITTTTNDNNTNVSTTNRLMVDIPDNNNNTPAAITLSPSAELLLSKSSSSLSLANSMNDTGIIRDSIDGTKQHDKNNVVPRPLPTILQDNNSNSGVLVVRVSYTKVDYGPSPDNPMLALSIVANRSPSMSAVAAAAADALRSRQRVITMDCEPGARPGLITWRRTFYLPVWDASRCHARLELGNASSSIKLNSYGIDLYTLDACRDFDADVNLEATAAIPLRDVVTRGVVRGTWRLREWSGGGDGHVVEDDDAERLDVGRAGLIMSWHPSTSALSSRNGDEGDGVK